MLLKTLPACYFSARVRAWWGEAFTAPTWKGSGACPPSRIRYRNRRGHTRAARLQRETCPRVPMTNPAEARTVSFTMDTTSPSTPDGHFFVTSQILLHAGQGRGVPGGRERPCELPYLRAGRLMSSGKAGVPGMEAHR